MSDTTENYLADLGREVLALAQAVRQQSAPADIFQEGKRAAFYQVLTLMKQQAQAFGLDDEAIGLKGVNLENLF